jgi:hypothetical protein
MSRKIWIILSLGFASLVAIAGPSSSRTVIAQFLKNGAGVLTLPTSTDTLVGRATTDTLTNKSISGSTNTLSNIPASAVSSGQVAVANGGTGLSSGTSGGVLAFTASGTLASSGALTASQLVIGGGAGVAPSSLAAGSQYQVLTMGAANPGYGAVNLAQAAAVTGALGYANGGTGQSSWTTGDLLYASGSNTLAKLPIGSASNVLTVSGGVPTWSAASAASGMVLLAETTATSTASVSFTSELTSSYEHYIIVISSLEPQTDGAQLLVTFSDDAGATWKATSYRHARFSSADGGVATPTGSASDTEIELNTHGNVGGEQGDYFCHLSDPANQKYSTYKTLYCDVGHYSGTPSFVLGKAGGTWDGGTGAITGIKFAFSSGNIAHARFRIYGLRETP